MPREYRDAAARLDRDQPTHDHEIREELLANEIASDTWSTCTLQAPDLRQSPIRRQAIRLRSARPAVGTGQWEYMDSGRFSGPKKKRRRFPGAAWYDSFHQSLTETC